MTMDISADNPEHVPAKVRDCLANVIEQCPGLSRAGFWEVHPLASDVQAVLNAEEQCNACVSR